MSKYTPFSLFIRQALLYPLASPFLPAEADVKLDVSYANGQKTGTYDPLVPALVWQTDPNLTFSHGDALSYAEYLEEDGVTVNENPQNIWRLPTILELMTALNETYLPGGSGIPSGFNTTNNYWSSSLFSETNHYDGINYLDAPKAYIDGDTNLFNVRCVKI
jgi:hypothetical protein